MATILDRIVENKRREIDVTPINESLTFGRQTVSFKGALLDSPTGIIAEFKRRSPSRGEIHPLALVQNVVPAYESAGAACCSVLTDTVYFGGALTDLRVARSVASLPLLRKDFVISRQQILQARQAGADAVLLIASILAADQVEKFTEYAHVLGLEVLFEIHNADELDRFCPGIDMVGVNNRDLTTFETNPELCAIVARELPDEVVKVAESGLTSMREVRRLRDCGYRGFLIGERFMKHSDPGEALRNFLRG